MIKKFGLFYIMSSFQHRPTVTHKKYIRHKNYRSYKLQRLVKSFEYISSFFFSHLKYIQRCFEKKNIMHWNFTKAKIYLEINFFLRYIPRHALCFTFNHKKIVLYCYCPKKSHFFYRNIYDFGNDIRAHFIL